MAVKEHREERCAWVGATQKYPALVTALIADTCSSVDYTHNETAALEAKPRGKHVPGALTGLIKITGDKV